ncbi:hypothetical protein I3760_12G101900 [Carya illinoinensis]|nr:hypothetical protein I3760_12G101900 [Carya illinoinensis]
MGLLYFLISLILLLTFSTPRLVLGNAELRALLELKSSLDPENKLLKSWTSEGDPCSGSFEGVACNEHRKVANISLQGKGLSGKVSGAVTELKCLSGLYLHYNKLSGEIPTEISKLTELTELYLDENNLSGGIPPELGNMDNLQVLQLCCNQLTGTIPSQMGSLKRLSVLSLQYNRLMGEIPAALGNLRMLRRLDLSFNGFSGRVPARLADIPQLEVLDVRNNSLSGFLPTAFRSLNEGFQYGNNPSLCGAGFPAVRVCSEFDNDKVNVDQLEPPGSITNNTVPLANPQSADFHAHCNQTNCSKATRLPQAAIITGVIAVTVSLTGAVFLTIIRYRRRKQKIGTTSDSSEDRLSTEQPKEFYRKSASPLVSLEYSNRWGPWADGRNGTGSPLHCPSYFTFNIEEVESATQYFSEANLLGKSNFSAVYKGVLRDGSLVAIRVINVTSCKSDEAEFMKGLKLLASLRHENLVRLRGFCCSRSRGECFLIYDFALNGNLYRYLDLDDGSSIELDWSKRVSVICGIAKGIGYLHSNSENKSVVIHQNISVEKILIDQQFNPLISDSGLPKLLADDVVFSTLKISAAMGYMAPEYITTGRFTEKSDIYAFGVIILQVLSGKRKLTNSMQLAAESCRFQDFIDTSLKGKYIESAAAKLAEIALMCTHELPNHRPNIEAVIQDLSHPSHSS